MNNTSKILLSLLGLLIIFGMYLASQYNSLLVLHEEVSTQYAQVETQYERRFALIPNLVESAKGVMKQEEKIFGDIAEARTRYSGAPNPEAKIEAANELNGALSRLLVIMENYPQLRSVETVQTLMTQLEGTENRISTERGRYNETVKFYNLAVKRFPTNIIAGMLGYSEKQYFEASQGAENAPKVSFE